ncbi:MAG: hypothetical protein K2H79_01190, partial [Bacteroidaceae bacterium]|nr:hypothetical protein [Bacteroidaceae bacterium]
GMKGAGEAKAILLDLSDYDLENTVDIPNAIAPKETTQPTTAGKNSSVIDVQIPAKTFAVYKVKK